MPRQQTERQRWQAAILDCIGCAVIVTDNSGRVVHLNPAAQTLLSCPHGDALGRHLSEVLPLAERGVHRTADTILAKVLNEGSAESLEGEILVARDGSERNVCGTAARVETLKGDPIGVVLALSCVTEQGGAAEGIRQPDRGREIELLTQASRAFASRHDLDNVVSTVLKGVQGVLNAAACSVWLVDPVGGGLVCEHSTDPEGSPVHGWRLEPGQGIAGWVAEQGQSVIVPDTRTDVRHIKMVDALTGVECRSILAVPMRTKRGVIGVIEVVDLKANRFGDSELRFAEALASTSAIAVENARLYVRNYDLAIERERHRLARELHDSATQALYSIALAARTSLRLLERTGLDAAHRRPTEHILALAKRTLVEMRELLWELDPATASDKTLAQMLAEHVGLLTEQYDLSIELTMDDEPMLTLEQRMGLFYIVREALWNTVKHACAKHVHVGLVLEGEQLVLRIADDGVGFDPPRLAISEARGIGSMEDRAQLLEGVLRLESSPGHGTSVTVRIPARIERSGRSSLGTPE